VAQQLERFPPSSFIPSTSGYSVISHLPKFLIKTSSARTRLSADGKSAAKGGARQYSGLIDVYKQTLKTDGIAGLYRGFVPSIVGIMIYRGL